MKLFKVFSKYPVYIFVGSGVTIVTVLLRSAIGFVIQDETTAKYIFTIISAYVIGIVLSFFAHKSITFKPKEKLSLAKILSFIFIHFVGMVLTLGGSLILKEKILDAWLHPEVSKMLAFGVAAFFVSLVTYLLKKYLVFN